MEKIENIKSKDEMVSRNLLEMRDKNG